MLLFDNKTKDPGKQTSQRIKLLSLVDSIVEANNGEPYTSALFEEAQVLVFCDASVHKFQVFHPSS